MAPKKKPQVEPLDFDDAVAELDEEVMSDVIAPVDDLDEVAPLADPEVAEEVPEVVEEESVRPPKFIAAPEPPDPAEVYIRVVDDHGHLLFKYNIQTKCIEIKVPVGRSSDKGSLFTVDVEVLKQAGLRNMLASFPSTELEAIRA